MTTIAFIGLGIMGSPMAVHLVERRPRRRRLNRSPEPAGPLVEPAGARPTSSPRRSAGPRWWPSWSRTPPTCRTSGRRGWRLRATRRRARSIIDFSTIRPDVTAAAGRSRRPSRASGCSTPRSPAARPAPSSAVLSIMVGGEADRLRRGQADPRRGRQDHRARRPERRRPDGQGGQPADRRRQHRGGRRGDRLPRGVRGRHRRRPRGARRRAGRQHGAGPARAPNMLGRQLRARLPDRPAPQGHGHRHLRGPRGRRRASRSAPSPPS